MEKVTTKRLALYTGRTHPALAQQVATHLNIEVGNDNLVEFANGEVRCSFGESVRFEPNETAASKLRRASSP